MPDIKQFLESIIELAHQAKEEKGEQLRDTIEYIRGDLVQIVRKLDEGEEEVTVSFPGVDFGEEQDE